MEIDIESIEIPKTNDFELIPLFQKLAVFIWSQIGSFIALGLSLLAIVPAAFFGSILLCYAPMPFVYSCIALFSLRKTHEYYARFQINRQNDGSQRETKEFRYTAASFGMALLCNLTLTTLFISVLISTGAEDFWYWCNGDIESVKLSPGFQAISVLVVSTIAYSMGHALVKLFFLPAIFFLAEERGNFREALQFAWNIVRAAPKLYWGMLCLEFPFVIGFIFVSLILMPLGLLFSFVTASLFQTSLFNAFSILVYKKSNKEVVLTPWAGRRWFFFGVFVFLLMISPLLYLLCREAISDTMSRRVQNELLEEEFDRAWNTALKIPVPAKREEAQFEVVQALSKEGRFDQAISLADQIKRDPWDRSIRRNQQRAAYQTIAESMIQDRQFERARNLAEQHFQEQDGIFKKIQKAEQSSMRSPEESKDAE